MVKRLPLWSMMFAGDLFILPSAMDVPISGAPGLDTQGTLGAGDRHITWFRRCDPIVCRELRIHNSTYQYCDVLCISTCVFCMLSDDFCL